MSDPPVQYVVVELALELGSVVGLDYLDPERQFGEEVVEELDGGTSERRSRTSSAWRMTARR